MQEPSVTKFEVVHDVWKEYLSDFETGSVMFDQILIINDCMYLRGPNLDLVHQFQSREQHIN